MLRRKIGSFFPIFLIAILVQIWAPTEHVGMMSPTASGSLSAPAFSSADCLHNFGAGEDQGAPAPHQQCPGAQCAFCSMGYSGVALAPITLLFVLLAPEIPPQLAPTAFPPLWPPAQRTGLLARPRAPPAFS